MWVLSAESAEMFGQTRPARLCKNNYITVCSCLRAREAEIKHLCLSGVCVCVASVCVWFPVVWHEKDEMLLLDSWGQKSMFIDVRLQ